jgi:glycosyltransferase involved in cell wall biosynthesis
MKLLIMTQVLDREHPVLGFFHRWVEEFAQRCDSIEVICLELGTHHLPSNVTVHSLGKEAGKGRLTYLLRFYTLLWSRRHYYDTVFVHMNHIYIILGALPWRLLRKRIGLWYAHGALPRMLHVATLLTHVVFTSTKEGFRIDTKKRVIVGQGIDTVQFVPGPPVANTTPALVTVGRISPSKNISTLLEACARLQQQGIAYHFTIVGSALTPQEKRYEARMRARVKTLGLDEWVTWLGPVANHNLPGVLQASDIFIHDGATNSLDKSLLEAALCGCVVVSSNPAYKSVTGALAPEYLFTVNDANGLVTIIKEVLRNPETESRKKVENFVREQFSIEHLTSGILSQYRTL